VTTTFVDSDAGGSAVTVAGTWPTSTNVPLYYGTNYLFNTLHGADAYVDFHPTLPADGAGTTLLPLHFI
jgi:hypothetical protein